jgi:hypothetical protein
VLTAELPPFAALANFCGALLPLCGLCDNLMNGSAVIARNGVASRYFGRLCSVKMDLKALKQDLTYANQYNWH